MPLLYSEDRFASTLPPELMDFMRENSVVRTLTKCEGGFRLENELYSCRLIDITYTDDGFRHSRMEQLFEQQVVAEKGNVLTVAMRVPKEAPAEPYFRAWVEQSINKAAWRTHEQITEEVRVASCLSANYLTTSPFVHRMLQVSFSMREVESANVVNAILNVSLPCLPQVDIATLMKIRQEETDAFQLFRADLARRLGELRNVTDLEELKKKTDLALRQLTEFEVQKVDLAVRNLRKAALAKTAVVVGALAATVQSHGLTLPGLGAALASGYASYAEYRAKVLENPAFFLWKILPKS